MMGSGKARSRALIYGISGLLCLPPQLLIAQEPAAPAAPQPAPETQTAPTTATSADAPAASSQKGTTPKEPESDKHKKVSPRHREEAQKLFLDGAKALDSKDSVAAMQDFSRARELDPDRKDYGTAFEIAKSHRVTDLVQDADKARILGQAEIARAKIRQAMELDPKNPMVVQHLSDLMHNDLDIDSATSQATIQLAPPIQIDPDILKASFHQRSSEPELIRQVLRTYGITAVIDDSVRAKVARLDLDDATYEQALRVLNAKAVIGSA